MNKYSKIQEWNKDAWKSELFFISKLRKEEFSDNQIEKILKTIETTCKHCWDNDNYCCCMRDE